MMPLAYLAFGLAAIPCALFLVNLLVYRRLPPASSSHGRGPGVSVLIPARNEASTIASAVESALSQDGLPLEVLVLDDHSTDDTARIVHRLASKDPRVRLIRGQPLPAGWCGKQHACWQLALEAREELLVFLDADVRLEAGSMRRCAAHFQRHPEIDLASGVPRQVTVSFLERLLIPLIPWVLLSYLPMLAARRWRWTALAAGCGQFIAARRVAYFAAGGHRAVRSTLHDGVKLPRAFRAAGLNTDLIDATDLARCRMYDNSNAVWRGLGKNATEGMAHPAAILPWTVLLLGGHVLPWFVLASAWFPAGNPAILNWGATAALLSLLPRLLGAHRFRQGLATLPLHPLAITTLILLQWESLARHWLGRPNEWRGRRYPRIAPEATPESGATS